MTWIQENTTPLYFHNSKNMKELKEPRQRKDNRRPDLEIYKPGLSRLRNRPKTKEASGNEEFKDEIVNDRDSSAVGNDTQLIQVCKELDSQQQNGPIDAENSQAQETFPKTVGLEDRSLKIIKRSKKPDLQIYQPGRRLQTITKESAGRADEEEILNQVEQLRIEEDECKGEAIKEEVNNKPDKTEIEKHQSNDRVVQEKARKSIEFLERRFESRDSCLRALTSRGNELESIAFRSEDITGQLGNNDDLILSCCLHYCKDKAKDYMPTSKEEPIRLLREVVLLTDDRNLRVKALTRNVPVRDIPAFLTWAQVG